MDMVVAKATATLQPLLSTNLVCNLVTQNKVNRLIAPKFLMIVASVRNNVRYIASLMATALNLLISPLHAQLTLHLLRPQTTTLPSTSVVLRLALTALHLHHLDLPTLRTMLAMARPHLTLL
jgi:hypothetical protein